MHFNESQLDGKHCTPKQQFWQEVPTTDQMVANFEGFWLAVVQKSLILIFGVKWICSVFEKMIPGCVLQKLMVSNFFCLVGGFKK